MKWLLCRKTYRHIFIWQFLSGNGLFAEFFGIWSCSLNMLWGALAKRWQLKRYYGKLQYNSSSVKSILGIYKTIFLCQDSMDWSTITQIKIICIAFKEVFTITKLFEVICTLHFSIQTLLSHVMTQVHRYLYLTEEKLPLYTFEFFCTFFQKIVLLKKSYLILIISYSKYPS